MLYETNPLVICNQVLAQVSGERLQDHCYSSFTIQSWFLYDFAITIFEMQIVSRRKVKSMERSETEAIRTQIQPPKSKREISNITNSQNTKRTYGQPSQQLFPKRWPLSNRNRTKNNMNTYEHRHEKTGFLHMRKQRRRSAAQ